MLLINYLLLFIAVLLAVPAVIILLECLLACLPARVPIDHSTLRERPSSIVLVPAHNEADGVAETIGQLRSELGPADRLLVVADNCTDATAEIARDAGADVIERSDPHTRGKGYAIAYAIDYINRELTPDVVILVDADCRISQGGVEYLARLAVAKGRPVQADYVLNVAGSDSPKTMLSALAILVKNRVRPRGLSRIGLPCHLTGSGMAFPWSVLRGAPNTESNLVEDMRMGIDLALRGFAPISAAHVSVTSPLPNNDSAATKQRRRWEHGHIATIFTQAPRLLARGITAGQVALLGLGLDLLVPPLALLIMIYLLAGVTFLVYGLLSGLWLPLIIVIAALGSIAVSVLISWWKFGRSVITFRGLLMIPVYLAWKIPLYISYCLGGAHSEWERTRRDAK